MSSIFLLFLFCVVYSCSRVNVLNASFVVLRIVLPAATRNHVLYPQLQ